MRQRRAPLLSSLHTHTCGSPKLLGGSAIDEDTYGLVLREFVENDPMVFLELLQVHPNTNRNPHPNTNTNPNHNHNPNTNANPTPT